VPQVHLPADSSNGSLRVTPSQDFMPDAPPVTTMLLNNNNNNTNANVYSAVIMAEPLREFARLI